MAIQAWYMAGRTRSFIAASTMQKFLLAPGFRYSTSVSSTPALPTSERPGSNSSSRWPWPRASMRCSSRVTSSSALRRRFVGVLDAQAAADVDVVDGDAGGLDRLDQVEQAVQRVEVGLDLR